MVAIGILLMKILHRININIHKCFLFMKDFFLIKRGGYYFIFIYSMIETIQVDLKYTVNGIEHFTIVDLDFHSQITLLSDKVSLVASSEFIFIVNITNRIIFI